MKSIPLKMDLDGLKIYQRLLQQVHPYKREFTFSILAMVSYAATEPAFAALMKPLLDGSFVERDHGTVQLMIAALIGVFLIRGFAGFVNDYYLKWVGAKVVADLRSQMFDRLLALSCHYFDRHNTGQIIAKLIYNVDQLANAASNSITVLVRDGFTVIGLMVYMLYLDAKLSLILLIMGPTMAFAIRYASRRFRRFSQRIQESVAGISHSTQEAIEGHQVIKAYGGQGHARHYFQELNERNRKLFMKMVATQAVSVPLVQFITAMAIALIVYLSTMEGIRQEITVGSFMSYVIAMGLLISPIKRLTSMNSGLQKGIVAADSVFQFLDLDIEKDHGQHTLERASGAIRFQEVSHQYSKSKGLVLHDINLDIAPGTMVALVGPSGSGKTSLVSLLPRFYDPIAGSITMDGVDIRDLGLFNLRQQIAIVSQQVVLFNDTIANNIAYGGIGAVSREAIQQAAEAAYLGDFIASLPEGLDTLVGDRGVLLSGGQRQRVAIARAILKNAPILILDEATSSLDSQSERFIQQALDTLMRQRTTLVVAHRLSTIERADLILVIRDGQILEQGSHAQLLARSGLYAELYAMQFRNGA